jgi:hypothetical protein
MCFIQETVIRVRELPRKQGESDVTVSQVRKRNHYISARSQEEVKLGKHKFGSLRVLKNVTRNNDIKRAAAEIVS